MHLSNAKPAHPRPGRITRAVAKAAHRLRESRIPFRTGQVVVGDDPFNGRREGTIVVIRSPHLGLRIPGTPSGSLVFFDHRNVRYPE
ncbi:hypothetical protein [Arthrobacter sp. UYEF20]|uniref:hypothetical protein n=1 Tax=Arthrobacter sp. UYEF20 TaxID=1756363 RepID=UPI0033972906